MLTRIISKFLPSWRDLWSDCAFRTLFNKRQHVNHTRYISKHQTKMLCTLDVITCVRGCRRCRPRWSNAGWGLSPERGWGTPTNTQTNTQTSDKEEPGGGWSPLQPSAGGTFTSVSRGMCRPFPCSTVDLRDLPGQARLRWLSARPDQEKTSW